MSCTKRVYFSRIGGETVCQPRHAARISSGLRLVRRTAEISLMSRHASPVLPSGHHSPEPYIASSCAAMRAISAVSAGSDGPGEVRLSLSVSSLRRVSAGSSRVSKRAACFASSTPALISRSFSFADRICVSSVM
jgi:hypothetical protein